MPSGCRYAVLQRRESAVILELDLTYWISRINRLSYIFGKNPKPTEDLLKKARPEVRGVFSYQKSDTHCHKLSTSNANKEKMN
jgi:hypothetical protein